jgi:hypothetical protein
MLELITKQLRKLNLSLQTVFVELKLLQMVTQQLSQVLPPLASQNQQRVVLFDVFGFGWQFVADEFGPVGRNVGQLLFRLLINKLV